MAKHETRIELARTGQIGTVQLYNFTTNNPTVLSGYCNSHFVT